MPNLSGPLEVDLAGSERVAKTAVEGQALREAININQSLFVLRKVPRGTRASVVCLRAFQVLSRN